MLTLDHKPWALDPRAFLKRMIGRAEKQGMFLDAVFENEFYLIRKTENGYESLDRSLCFSGIGMDSAEEVIQDIVAALSGQGIIVEQYMPELGPGSRNFRATRGGTALGGQSDYVSPDRARYRGTAWTGRLVRTKTVRELRRGMGHTFTGARGIKRGRKIYLWTRRTPTACIPLAYAFIGGVLKHLPVSAVRSQRRP